jgi:MFS family permease
MAEETESKRYTVLTVILMLLATVVALGVGFMGFGLWMTNMMTFAGTLDGAPENRLALAIFLFLSAGPFAAGAGIILGWLSFIFFRAPRTGVKLVFFIPVIWGVALLAYMAIVTTVCDGSFTCGYQP